MQALVEEEKLDSFNIPQYTSSPSEVKSEVEMEGYFGIDRLEVFEINWNAYNDKSSDFYKDGAYNVAKCMRAVAEPLLLSHFSAAIIDEVFSRYRKIVANIMSKERTEFINVTVAMTKKGWKEAYKEANGTLDKEANEEPNKETEASDKKTERRLSKPLWNTKC
ncbi:unnamed protein product [Ilex paraguariensis]|uniref:Uncharacterized protein n=1 Tax=Ilex paraguariensis TaxID=185542 RepID=A0ABC8SMR0_9AQUA